MEKKKFYEGYGKQLSFIYHLYPRTWKFTGSFYLAVLFGILARDSIFNEPRSIWLTLLMILVIAVSWMFRLAYLYQIFAMHYEYYGKGFFVKRCWVYGRRFFKKILVYLRVAGAIIIFILYAGITLSVLMWTGPIVIGTFGTCMWLGLMIYDIALSHGIEEHISILIGFTEVCIYLGLVIVPIDLYGEKFLKWWFGLYEKIGELV